ncbi:MAG: 6-bladed beta-propeller [Gemmatimonadaceae bacterium]|nr:6-bladed beta-propeller [Gemmatimonadaceae bacterium]
MALTRRTATILLAGLFGWTGAAGAQRVIEGPATDVPLKWTLTREWSVGGAEDDDLVLTQLWAKDLAVDGDRLFVNDRAEWRVAVYGADGKRRGSIGRKGEGPGEFLMPGAIAIAPDRSLYADDYGRERLLRFNAAGDLIDESPRAAKGNVFAFRFLTDGSRVGRYTTRDSAFVGIRRGEQRVRLAALKVSPTKSTPRVCRVTDYPVAPIFESAPTWDATGTTVVVSTGAYAVDVFAGDSMTHRLSRAKLQRRSTPALARTQVGNGPILQLIGMPPCTVPADMILAVAEIADVIPAYSALTLDHKGRVWATHFTVGDEPGKADVYDLRSGYLGTVNLGSARPAAFFPDGRMVSIELDEDEVPMIRVYRITP